MRCDGVHDREECFHESGNNEWIRLAAHSNLVALLDAEHVIEQHDDLLVLHFVIVRLGLIDALVDLINHQLIPQIVVRCTILAIVDWLLGKIVIDPLLEVEEL